MTEPLDASTTAAPTALEPQVTTDPSAAVAEAPAQPPRKRRVLLWVAIPVVAVFIVGGSIVGVILAKHDAQPSKPVIYVSKADGYSAAFPGKPKVTSDTEGTGDNAVPITETLVDHGTEAYEVAAITLPAEVPADGLDDYLQSAVTAAASGDSGKVLTQKFGTVAGERALTATMSTSAGIDLDMMVLVRQKTEYLITAATRNAADRTAFLHSFALTD